MVQFTRSGKFNRTSTTTNTTTNETLSTYGYYGSSGIYTAGADTTLTGSSFNEAFIYDLTLSGTNALRFSGFTSFDAGAGDDIMDFTVRPANAGHEYGTDATLYGGLGNDVIWTAGSHLTQLYGDDHDVAGTNGSPVVGGNDRIDASAATAASIIYGDAYTASYFIGGNDTITGSSLSGDSLCGDVQIAGNGFVGGNDTLFTGGSSGGAGGSGQVLVGDAALIGNGTDTTDVVCGNDALHDDATGSLLIGDAMYLQSPGTIQGGNDVLDGGGGDDMLVGDYGGWSGTVITAIFGGNDTFVFQPGSGNDTIEDFGQATNSSNGQDQIDVSAYGITSFAQLNISDNGSKAATITFGGGNSVTVKNTIWDQDITLTDLSFIFAT
ncbi:hypothetical protein [Ancylobacter lacus]|uniref:hypothetical protein n=1 Tax=Ancylobacter lacus TaxID=2579970 RepID=UPI001BD046A2|nr:hypothetical protein [Ancylobacter lacus]MBS7540579.1 hypothetical protein [Ancylobacter lacus]